MSEADRVTSREIMREIREGTPNTPQRVAPITRADAVFRNFTMTDASRCRHDRRDETRCGDWVTRQCRDCLLTLSQVWSPLPKPAKPPK